MALRRLRSTAAVIAAGWLAAAGTAFAAGVDQAATVDAPAVRSDLPVDVGAGPAPTARYRVTLVIEWSAATHPATLPPNDHVSQPVAATHRDPGSMFADGALASPGIERMAEEGATATLRSELVADPTVGDIVIGAGRFGPGTITFDVDADLTHHRLSLVTMLAPSPDWFLGADSMELFDHGAWVPRIERPLGPYDAGTDDGVGFLSANADSSPPLPISGPRDAGFTAAAAEGSFGRVVVERLP